MLDTATLIYLDSGSPRLSSEARRVLADAENRLFMSVLSVWELHVKTTLGRLALPEAVPEFVRLLQRAHDITSLALRDEDLAPLATLPLRHRDPFDRGIMSQSIARSLVIVTPDQAMRRYREVRSVW